MHANAGHAHPGFESGEVVALVFVLGVVAPVVVEVAAGARGAEFEDGFGTVKAPAGACDAHAIRVHAYYERIAAHIPLNARRVRIVVGVPLDVPEVGCVRQSSREQLPGVCWRRPR